MKLRLPPSYYNTISYAGTAFAIIFFFMFGFLYVLSSLAYFDKAYVGIVIFIVIPLFIIFGLILIPIGMVLRIRQMRKKGIDTATELPVLNLNLPYHRNAALIFAVGTVTFLFFSALGSYEAYHFTESNKFCGTLCHNLMVPEYTAYQLSPHARVNCSECHIGSGANWYVKSKLSGLRQVYKTIANTYPRPIPTPIKSLRPARETCEQCHWPEKVYGKQQRNEIYYLPDENNTRWEIELLMNTGGGNPALGQSSGIHWHINPDIKIEYITTDEQRLEIPRVIMINTATRDTVIFNSTENPLNEKQAEFMEQRVMDCVDCHTRPSHVYRDPSKFTNIALAAGEASPTLPMFKQTAIEACMQDFETTQEAMLGIDSYIRKFYTDNYPEIMKEKSDTVHKSIEGIQKEFSNNIFPEMKVKWEDYPDHIGHMTAIGCFRCHDGSHVNTEGEAIPHHCDECHTIIAQGPTGYKQFASSNKSLEFKHPVDIDEAWKEVGCYECHAVPPL
jgi:hypothetical protein